MKLFGHFLEQKRLKLKIHTLQFTSSQVHKNDVDEDQMQFLELDARACSELINYIWMFNRVF